MSRDETAVGPRDSSAIGEIKPAHYFAEILVAQANPRDRELIGEAWRRLDSPRPLRLFPDARSLADHLGRCGRDLGPSPALVVIDMSPPMLDEHEVLRDLGHQPSLAEIPVVALSSTIDEATWSYAVGCGLLIAKPRDLDGMVRVCRVLGDLCARGDQRRTVRDPTESGDVTRALAALEPAGSAAMQALRRRVRQVMGTVLPVVISGESGVGKERVARIIHEGGARAAGPWVSENCAALAPELMESELFGHCKGAFTGAVADKIGLFECANLGTLFLDEVGEMPLRLQSKLLRVLEERQVRPVGTGVKRAVDARVISATNRDLTEMCRRGEFREDLYFRLAVLRLEVPPLRERLDDLPALVRKLAHELTGHTDGIALTSSAWDALATYSWPGNVRELANVLTRLALFGDGKARIDADVVRRELAGDARGREVPDGPTGAYEAAQGRFESIYLERLLSNCGGNVLQASAMSGIPRATLYRLMKKSELRPADFRADDL